MDRILRINYVSKERKAPHPLAYVHESFHPEIVVERLLDIVTLDVHTITVEDEEATWENREPIVAQWVRDEQTNLWVKVV